MTERRVPQIMGQRNGFDKVFIQMQTAGNGASELGYLERMGQAGTKEVSLMVQKYLGFIN